MQERKEISFTFKVADNRIIVKIQYPRQIWEKLEKYYIRKGLEKTIIHRAWGEYRDLLVYRIPENTQSPWEDIIYKVHHQIYDRHRISVYDDINRPLVNDLCHVNLAFMRIVPTCDSSTCIVETEAPANPLCTASLKMLPKIIVTLVKEFREIEKPRIAEITIKIR